LQGVGQKMILQKAKQQLNLRISASDAPDMYLPVNGMENDLAKNGSIIEMSKQLQEKSGEVVQVSKEDEK
jgi:putative aldouronate transport system substrate-binding protein